MNKALMIIGLSFLFFGVKKMTQQPRGMRNNNAGNIRLTNIKWDGMSPVQRDSAFIQFVSPEYGLRALAKIIMNYQTLYGLNTIRGVISRYAPSIENNTQAYIDAVARQVGASPDAPLDFSRRGIMQKMISAIVQHENGMQPYTVAQIDKSLTMAGIA